MSKRTKRNDTTSNVVNDDAHAKIATTYNVALSRIDDNATIVQRSIDATSNVARDERVAKLIDALSNETSLQRKKQLRRALRALGHWGASRSRMIDRERASMRRFNALTTQTTTNANTNTNEHDDNANT